MTNTTDTPAEARLPASGLFMDGKVPEPLNEEQRLWLAEQLHAWPDRVNEDRTCCIGALTDMATTEFCRLMSERTRATPPVEMPRGWRRALHELDLSARVFRDYERQHMDRAECTDEPRERADRLRKAKRNGERAACCEEALAYARAALAAASLPDDRLRVAREALENLLSALSPLKVAGKPITSLNTTLSRRVTEAVQALATLGEPAQSGETK